jgi:DNA-binding transcriptional ArsR family regulator
MIAHSHVQQARFDSTQLYRLLGNNKRLEILHYLKWSGMASSAAILRNCQIQQSTLSRLLKSLVASGLVTSHKILKSTIVYRINGEVIQKLTVDLNGFL